MPIITFWSNNEKAIGQTVSASLVATVMAIQHNYKVLLVSADYNNSIMEKCFGAQESNKEIVKTLINKPQISLDSGIKGLLKMAESNRITPETIHDYTKIIFKNRLEVLYSPTDIIEQESKILEHFKNIIINASKYYDYIIVDLKKGIKNVSQLEILEMSDVVILDTNQDINQIQKALRNNETKKVIHKSIWNICKYDEKSKYNIKNLSRSILRKCTIYEIPYNTLLMEASQEGTLVELIIRFKTLKDEDENLTLISKTEELIQGILLKYQQMRSRM